MKLIRFVSLTVLAFFACLMSNAQNVTVENKLDSVAIFIGQRMGITLEVTADKGKNIELPKYDSLQQIIPGVEYLSATRPDTQYINDGKRMVIKKKYFITSFDSALYYLPAMEVKVDGKTFKAKHLALKVVTLDVDTLHPEKVCPNKPVMTPPFLWSEWRQAASLSFIVVIIGIILIYVIIRLKDNKPIIRRIKFKQHIAPHKMAMKKIDQIKEEKIWQKEDSKEYYTQLTDALRQYIKERYEFNATEMTTYEIIQNLQDVNDDEALRELRELFETADLVKFAKYSTLANENDRNLVYAIEYINQTKVEEEVKPQPEEIVVEEQHSKDIRRILIILTIITSIVLICVVGYMSYRMTYILM